MIGTNNYSVIEFEFFVMVYTLSVLHQLIHDGYLSVPNIPGIIQTQSHETIIELSQKYPLPTYELMAQYAFKILDAHNKITAFTANDLYTLFYKVEVNNGYVL